MSHTRHVYSLISIEALNFPNNYVHRVIHQEKRHPAEFGDSTCELHSLQVASFLFNICHVVLLVTDCPDAAADSAKFLLTSEMLKPSSPAYESSEDGIAGGAVIEHLPDLVLIRNKATLGDLAPSAMSKMAQFYDSALSSSSQLRLRSGLGMLNNSEVNLFALPDFELGQSSPFDPSVTFDASVSHLRRLVLSASPRPLTTVPRQTEKTWFGFAKKSWESVKSSTFYLEYNRLLS